MRKKFVGILGATGLVGQQFMQLLNEHPFFELCCITASDRSAGKIYNKAVDWFYNGAPPENGRELILVPTQLKEILKQEVDIVFSALPSNVADRIETALAKEGIYVFSNASTHRMDKDVPILIPEINPDHLQLVTSQNYGEGFIVTNSNCSTSGLVFGLKPLEQFGLQSVYVTTYQSLSGAGRRGVASTDILGNIIPYINNEEEKIEIETKKILGTYGEGKITNANFYVNASCARVPVTIGHLESIIVELEKEITVEEAKRAFETFIEVETQGLPLAPKKPIILSIEEGRPQPTKDILLHEKNVNMSVTIGRIRKKNKRLNFFLLVHNLVRGASGTAILNAEYALKKKYLK